MKRSTPLQRKTPLKSGGFSRKSSPLKNLASSSTLKRRMEINSRIKRPTVTEGSKYLAACRGEPCYLRVPGVCRLNPMDDTVVPCHDNSLTAGKGMGIKASHERTVPGCFWCHAWLDHGKAPRWQKSNVFLGAYNEWGPVRARKMGLTEEVCDLS
ncbi:nuclease domain-containing protein [Burkholderia ubonensis]|uniref:nuclease domain-containing protein n=1 Tax=Burkholderia ubonensis TaxID=101571 RepID=UPI0008FDA901|nr:nuclease domain-containing protein [Burkholderia ubonensis]